MQRWRRATPFALAASLAALLFVGYWQLREPSFQGKPLSQWVMLFVDTNAPIGWASEKQQRFASDAVRHMGPKATLLLFEWASYDYIEAMRNYQALPAFLSRSEIVSQYYVNKDRFRNNRARGSRTGPHIPRLGRKSGPPKP